MKTTAAEILSAFAPQGLIKEMVGPDQPINRIVAVEDCAPGDLVFVDKVEYVAVVKQRRPAVVVTSFKLKALLAGGSDLILLLTSMFCVAGSTTIGNRVMMSGQTGIKDHVTICDDVVLVHRAGVTADIDQPGAYAGLPVQPLKDYMRNTAESHMLADLRQRVLTLERPDGTPVP